MSGDQRTYEQRATGCRSGEPRAPVEPKNAEARRVVDLFTGLPRAARRPANWRWSHVSEDPVAVLHAAHAEQLALCDCLEEIADHLPNANRQRCIYAAKVIGPLTVDIHRFEETILFPLVERRLGSSAGLSDMLQRLKFEHCEDECFTEELTEALLELGSGDARMGTEAIGYMLRGFFAGMRRHIAFERDHLLKLLEA